MKEWKKPIIESIDVSLTRGGFSPETTEKAAITNVFNNLKIKGLGQKLNKIDFTLPWSTVKQQIINLSGVSTANDKTMLENALEDISPTWSNLNIS